MYTSRIQEVLLPALKPSVLCSLTEWSGNRKGNGGWGGSTRLCRLFEVSGSAPSFCIGSALLYFSITWNWMTGSKKILAC